MVSILLKFQQQCFLSNGQEIDNDIISFSVIEILAINFVVVVFHFVFCLFFFQRAQAEFFWISNVHANIISGHACAPGTCILTRGRVSN